MRPALQRVDGILLLDKPAGLTSNGALQRVKRLFNARKAGHTGSLDPLATGMLPICFGEATKVSQFLLDSDKHYEVQAVLGIRTTTADAEGEVISSRPVPSFTVEQLSALFAEFSGWIDQIPPMFSALKHQGKPLYRFARAGIEIERESRRVRIDLLKLLGYQSNCFDVTVHCSKGTYVRTLIEDIGERLGCGAHVGALRRTAVVPYQNGRMVTLPELEELRETAGVDVLKRYLLPVDSSVGHLPSVRLSSAAAFYIKTGQSVMVPHVQVQGLVRLFDEKGNFIGVGEMTEDGRIAPKRLVALDMRVKSA